MLVFDSIFILYNEQGLLPLSFFIEFCSGIVLLKYKKYQSNTYLKKNAQTSTSSSKP